MTGAEGPGGPQDRGVVPAGGAPIFILSFRQHDELAAMAERAGWKTTAARRADAAERRFIASGASIAVVDARGAFADGLAAVQLLADPVQSNASALLVLLSRNDVAGLDTVFDAGATHYLVSPFGEQEFAQMLRFAERHAERMAGSHRTGRIETIEVPEERRDPGRRDVMTGLADGHGARRWIEERLRSRSSDPAVPKCVLLMLAITRFDMINAAYGQATGDALLQGVARRIERMVAEGGPRRRMVARMAGAEFAVGLAAPATTEEAVFLAGQLAAAVARPFVSGDHVITLSCRVGVAAADEPDADPGALLRRASAALADAKGAEAAGAVRVLDASGEAETAHENRLEIDLRLALDQDEIGLLFQPQVDVTTGKIAGVEALARWRHPRLGELGALPLFAAAERSDYLTQLSAHVQKKAVDMAKAWPAALAKVRLAVNVTAADMAAPDFAEQFLAMVDASGFPRSRLTVEVTESGLIEDLSAAASLLARLRAAGLRVAIDDFGTGYSSLAYLKALPLDYLKIDRRLSQDIAGSTRDRVVVRSVIEMARSLGLAVIAEGVETEEQLSLLAREGCNYYQGFLCSPPVDVAALVELVDQ